MEVQYIHTFTVTVVGHDNFSAGTSLEQIEKYGARDASLVRILAQRGVCEPEVVRSKVTTQTIVKFGEMERVR